MLQVPGRFRPARADWAQAGLVTAVLFVLYAATAVRTVATEDDSLFVLSSYFLGIEHPPGYPLFTLIGHLFSHLPFGSVAYRVHLASSMFGALSGGAAWLCARSLMPGRLPAYLAAFGLGASPVFWSQAIIAEVYTLNTFFLLVLVYLGLQVCPPSASEPGAPARRILPLMAFIFGLSLSNHYPLMLLVAPAFVFLLWPVRADFLKSLPLLGWLFVLGLAPYVWMVYRSLKPLPISFYGPLETFEEIWYFVSRSGYAQMDQSLSANWYDRIKFFEFMASQVFVQFAIAGTLLAATGFAVQWRVLGNRAGTFLTVAFLMPSMMLLILLGFDYDMMHKHIFQVYPLPAYAVAALWMGLGFAWLANRFALRVAAGILASALLAAILGVGAQSNLFDDEEWIARFAQKVLAVVPKDAVLFGKGDPDLAPMAYFHMIEGQRPDITLYQPQGLVLGNRLFHSERTDDETAKRILRDRVERETRPVVTTLLAYAVGAQRDRWLYSERDPSSSDPKKVTVELTDEAMQYFEQEVAQPRTENAWLYVVQGELRRMYASLLARTLSRGKPIDARKKRHLELLSKDFYGVVGITEGLLLNKEGYPAGVVADYLDKVRDLMPSDVTKDYLARYFQLRAALRGNSGDHAGALKDLETSLSIWPTPSNPSIESLQDLYRDSGDSQALSALQDRVKSFKRQRY